MALCSSAAAQPTTPVSGVRWYIRVSPKLVEHLTDDCFTGVWRYSGGRHEPYALSNFPFFGDETGSWDPVNATLSVASKASENRGPHFMTDFAEQEHIGHSWSIDQVGLEYRKGRAELSGVIHPAGRPYGSKARRQVFAVIPHASLTAGLGHRFVSPLDDRGTVPNSLMVVVRGRAHVAPAFVAAAGRWRCRHNFANYKYNRVRRGEPLGTVSAEVAPSEARGLAGTLDSEIDFSSGAEEMTVTPIAPATKHGGGIRFPIATSNARLRCDVGFDCTPSGDGLTVAGGFTLGYHGRTVTVGDLAFSWAFDGTRDNAAVTGTVDGQLMQIADANLKITAAFLEHVRQAVGAEVVDGALDATTLFTQTGPL